MHPIITPPYLTLGSLTMDQVLTIDGGTENKEERAGLVPYLDCYSLLESQAATEGAKATEGGSHLFYPFASLQQSNNI